MAPDKKEIITHPDKLYFPKENITKGEVAAYYEAISDYILPYLKNRPLVMHRFPEGIEGISFIQKEAGRVPNFVKTALVHHEDHDVHYILVNNLKTLLYVVNLGSIEMHPFNAPISHLDKPTYLIFDLDPEAVPFEAVIETARALHKALDEEKIPNFCKTSGSRGLHLFVPVDGKTPFDDVRDFAFQIATRIHDELPDITSLERSPKKRQGRVYIDTLQNREMQTIAAPYSLRAKPGAPVSTPLHWDEVKKGLDPKKFNIHTISKRLDKMGDIWKGGRVA